MRVLHVAWEYPPLIYGGLGRHVEALTRAQARRGDDVIVLTQSIDGRRSEEDVQGVTVIRAPHDPPTLPFGEETLLAWVLGMQTGMIRAASGIGPVDVVHAHDWVVAHAAIALRDSLPASALVATMHATEAGRHQGWLPGPLSEAIHAIEHWLVHEAEAVIVCSQHMAREIARLYDVGAERTSVIVNGIDLTRWRSTPAHRARARQVEGPLVVFVGRLEWEKGVHTLLDALPRLRRRIPGLRAVIAGQGSQEAELIRRARTLRLGRSIEFTGWLPDAELRGLVAGADVLVVPSIYEPFGMVAMEGAALGAPLVVAQTGGLGEFVTDKETGRTFEPADAGALADAVEAALADPRGSARMARAARARLRQSHGWPLIAEATDAAYQRAIAAPRSATVPSARIPDRSVNLLGP